MGRRQRRVRGAAWARRLGALVILVACGRLSYGGDAVGGAPRDARPDDAAPDGEGGGPCGAGYELADGGCVDIDECAGRAAACSVHAACVNVPGSHTCRCLEGYEGDGARCIEGQRQLSAGEAHVCIVRAGGVLYCWGGSWNGQLGRGDFAAAPNPVPFDPAASPPVTWSGVATAWSGTCALTVDGAARCAGWGAGGLIGDGDLAVAPTPRHAAAELGRLRLIAMGFEAAFALTGDGALYAWGANDSGELGLGFVDDAPHPTAARVGAGDDWRSVAGGPSHACGIRGGGELWCWGGALYGELGDGVHARRAEPGPVPGFTDFEAVALGTAFTCGIRSNGELLCFGANDAGQLGDGTVGDVPDGVHRIVAPGERFVSLAARRRSACAVRDDGALYCWGANDFGQLGDGTFTHRASPTRVGEGTDWADVVLSAQGTCGVRTDGRVQCWGTNGYGQRGDGTIDQLEHPTRVGERDGWHAPTLGAGFTCVRDSEDASFCTGANVSGQLGDGTRDARETLAASFDGLDVDLLEAGAHTACAIDADGALWCWGNGVGGATALRIGDDSDWESVSAGEHHLCGLRAAGEVHCMGEGSAGQLGGGSFDDSAALVLVGGGLPPARAVSAGVGHTCAVTVGGALYCWGANDRGQLGDGGVTGTATPVRVGTDTGWAVVSAGGGSTCAVREDGSLWCWGSNSYGQLAQGSTDGAPHGEPARVGADTDWGLVGVGLFHACGVREGGRLHCWGRNGVGTLGVGDTVDRASATEVLPAGGWEELAVASYHACATREGGQLYCWGWNPHGQLGQPGAFRREPGPVVALP